MARINYIRWDTDVRFVLDQDLYSPSSLKQLSGGSYVATWQLFSSGNPVSSTDKAARPDTTEIFWKWS